MRDCRGFGRITEQGHHMIFPSITNHCIIEEHDDHMVLAIRIPKAEIAKNIHLLAALADVVPTVAVRSAPVAEID